MTTGKTVDEMIDNLPRLEQVMVRRLRTLVLECLPKATEKAYYGLGIPFYTHHRQICFIWPASVFWGPNRTAELQKKKGTTFGFCQGNLMSNDDGILLAEGRKQIYVMYFHSINEINDAIIRSLLFEAGLIDDSFGEKKRKLKKLKK